MKEKLKVNLSIFELLLRNGGLKLAAVILLTMLTEGVLLYTMMQKETLYYENLFARGAAIPLMVGFILLSLAMLQSDESVKKQFELYAKEAASEAGSHLRCGGRVSHAGVCGVLGVDDCLALWLRCLLCAKPFGGTQSGSRTLPGVRQDA